MPRISITATYLRPPAGAYWEVACFQVKTSYAGGVTNAIADVAPLLFLPGTWSLQVAVNGRISRTHSGQWYRDTPGSGGTFRRLNDDREA